VKIRIAGADLFHAGGQANEASGRFSRLRERAYKTVPCCIIAVKLINYRSVWSLLPSNESKLRAVYLDEEGFRLVSCYRPVLLSHLLERAPRLLSGSMTHTLHQLLAVVAFVPSPLAALCARGSTRHSLVSL
jgi:hypothetical protein